MIPGWHPLVVHFPLALISTAGVCSTLAFIWPKNRHAAALATVGAWNLSMGALALLAALATGLSAALHLNTGPSARLALSAHVKSAVLTALVTLLAAVWRGVGVPAQSRPAAAFMAMLWAAVACVLITGYLGAQNVYVHGMGVEAAR